MPKIDILTVCKVLYTSAMLIPLAPLCMYPARNYIKSRTSALLFKTALRLAVFIFFSVILSHLFTVIPTRFLTAMCAGAFFFYFYWKEVELPFNKSLFIFLTVYMIGGFSRIFATLLEIFLYPDHTYYDISAAGFLFQFAFLLLMDLVLYRPFTKYLGWLVSHFHSRVIWNCVCPFPFLCIVVTYILVPHNYSWMYIGRAGLMYMVVIACMLVLLLLLYLLFYQFVHTYMEKQKIEHNNRILSVQGAQYQQLLRSVQENSRIRHDFRHQIVVISELLSQKEYTRLEEYLSSYIQNTETELKIYSYSPALNAILSYYEALCRSKNITPDFSLGFINSQLPVNEQDLCVMLGNLLENAVYGCENTDTSYVRLKIVQTSPSMLAIKICNPYSGTVKNINGTYLSSRHGGTGQGLESVQIIAEKYSGCMEIQSENSIFIVKVLLQLA